MSPDSPDSPDSTAPLAHEEEPTPTEESSSLPALVAAVTSLKCGSIIIIDDEVPDIELIRAELVSMVAPPAPLQSHVQARGGWPEKPEGRWDTVQAIVDSLPYGDRRALTGLLYTEVSKGAVDWESALAAPLLDLKGNMGGLAVLSVSPREWEKHGPTFDSSTDDTSDSKRDLPLKGTPICLFDYDLSKVAGRRIDQGLVLAKDLIGKAGDHGAYCGVISHTFNNPRAATLVRNGMDAADRDRIALLSRKSMQDYASFANGLRAVYRAHSAMLLRRLTRNELVKAHETAMKGLDELEVAPLLHVVVDRSYFEGISEFETLKRLYFLKLGSALDQTDIDGALQPLIADIRAVKLSDPVIPAAVFDLEHEERYADIAIVNRRHLPVELGDVFLIGAPSGAKRKYILVTQPCDLMVRSTGDRKITHGVLLGVSEGRLDPETGGFPLKFAKARAPDGNRGHLYVRFSPPLYLPLFVLDLAVFSPNGESALSLDANTPETMPASMRVLHECLQTRVGEIIASAQAPLPNVDPALPLTSRQLLVPVGAVEGVAGELGDARVRYDCQRVMRLSPRIASELLAEYSHFTGRAAAEMEMAQRA